MFVTHHVPHHVSQFPADFAKEDFVAIEVFERESPFREFIYRLTPTQRTPRRQRMTDAV